MEVERQQNTKEGTAISMLRKDEGKQLNFYSVLYQNIPENHILKKIESAISFEFINEMLADSYCRNFERPAKEPAMITKLLMLQEMYGLSEVNVIEEASVNLAIMWIIGINPGDSLNTGTVSVKPPISRKEKRD